MANAPVCHIPPTTPDNGQLPKNLPAIPPATDLKSALNAINVMRQIIQIITNQQPIIINQGQSNNSSKFKTASWRESSRKTEKIKVYNPQDKSQWVEIERINELTMEDNNSNSTWRWTRAK
jgi:hypothetical protein